MYEKKSNGWKKHLDFIILDILCLMLSMIPAYMIRKGNGEMLRDTQAYYGLNMVMAVLDFVILISSNAFKKVLNRGYYLEMLATIRQAFLLTLSTTACLFITQTSETFSRVVVLLTIVLYSMLSYVIRIFWKMRLRKRMKEQTGNALLIMADEKEAARLIPQIEEHNYASYRINGVVVPDKEKKIQSIQQIPVVSTYENVVAYVTGNWVDEVLISVKEGERIPGEIINTLMGMGVTVHIHLNIDGEERTIPEPIVNNIGNLLVMTCSNHYITPAESFMKRTIDIAGALVGCLLACIAYPFVAMAIKRESPGPVIFKQTRIGKNGKTFQIYKFRTMYLDAEERKAELMAQNRIKDGMMFKMDFDPRIIGNRVDDTGKQITGIGNFLRRYSIDELPQFFNVLKGDMSLVGTRPPVMEEYAKYSAHHKARLAIKPGITGLWQISGRSDILDFEEVVRLDTEYINNWSVGLDIRILVKTVGCVLKKEGSM